MQERKHTIISTVNVQKMNVQSVTNNAFIAQSIINSVNIAKKIANNADMHSE